MKDLAEFPTEFLAFVHEEARKEAQGIVKEKDLPRSSFSLNDLRDFSYKDQLLKFQRTNPILTVYLDTCFSSTTQ